MNRLTFLKKLEIYTKLLPPFIPGVLIIVSLFLLLSNQESPKLIDSAWILLFVGLLLVLRKLFLFFRYIKMVEFGKRAEAILIDKTTSIYDPKGKAQCTYHFEYQVENQNYIYSSTSSYLSDLSIGSKIPLYYLRKNPQNVFAPAVSAINLQ